MLLEVLFVVLTITLVTVDSRHGIDLEGILEILDFLNTNHFKLHNGLAIYNHDHSIEESSHKRISDIIDNSQQGAMTKDDIKELIKKASEGNTLSNPLKIVSHLDLTKSLNLARNRHGHLNQHNKNVKTSETNDLKKVYLDYNEDQNQDYHIKYKKHLYPGNRLSDQHLTYFPRNSNLYNKSHKRGIINISEKRIMPSTLLESYTKDNDYGKKQDKACHLILVLDPVTLRNNKNRNVINSIISRLGNLSSDFHKSRSTRDQPNKGFLEYARRFKFSSDEMNNAKDSQENYKPKRSRGDHLAGRTAIPYISHRGDIYERE